MKNRLQKACVTIVAFTIGVFLLAPQNAEARLIGFKQYAELYLQSGYNTSKVDIAFPADNKNIKPTGGHIHIGYIRDFYFVRQLENFFVGADFSAGYLFMEGETTILDENYNVSLDFDFGAAVRVGYEVLGSKIYIKSGLGYTQVKEQAEHPEISQSGRNFHFGPRYGGGVSFKLTSGTNVGIDYTYAEYNSEYGPVDINGHIIGFRLLQTY